MIRESCFPRFPILTNSKSCDIIWLRDFSLISGGRYMNRIAKFFVSVAAAASLTVGAGVSASAECVYFSDVADFEVISLSRIESSTRYNCFPGYGGRLGLRRRLLNSPQGIREIDNRIYHCTARYISLCGVVILRIFQKFVQGLLQHILPFFAFTFAFDRFFSL